MKVVFRIKRQYFDAIIAGTKTVELRKFNYFWAKRLRYATEAIFICGKDVHKRKINNVVLCDPEIALGRQLTADEKELIPGRACFAIYLGEQIKS